MALYCLSVPVCQWAASGGSDSDAASRLVCGGTKRICWPIKLYAAVHAPSFSVAHPGDKLLLVIKLVGDSTDPNVVGAIHGVPSHVRQNQLRVLLAYPAYYTYGCQWHPPPAGAGYHAGYRWYASKPIGGTP